jgi:molecular chaperone GrpE
MKDNNHMPQEAQPTSDTTRPTTGDDPTPAGADGTQEVDLGAQLQEELDKVRTEAAEYLEGWQRARAEFANYRKRVDRERQDLFKQASVDVLKQLLPVIDDFDRAVENVPQEIADNNWVQGMSMVRQKFQTILDNNDLQAIDPLGEAFDPNKHEAIGTDDSTEMESGHITAVLQKGYVHGEHVLRPALVRVAN